jgi:hypothetical protein
MKTFKEAVSEENYKRWDRGERMTKPPKIARPELKEPKIPDKLTVDKIDLSDIDCIMDGRRSIKKNTDGSKFIGFHVKYQDKEGKVIEGWMPEVDYLEFRRLLFRNGNVNVDNIEY